MEKEKGSYIKQQMKQEDHEKHLKITDKQKIKKLFRY